jgi:hypothetical protein
MKITQEMMSHLEDYCLAIDQRKELRVGDDTWVIYTGPGSNRGQMSVYASGRGAIETGGDSAWGEWDGESLHLDGGLNVVDSDGWAVD